MIYNKFKESKKKKITLPIRDIYSHQVSNLTYKGLGDGTTIQLSSNITNIPATSSLKFDQTGGEEPAVDGVFSINSNTSQILDFSDGNLDISSTNVYHIINLAPNVFDSIDGAYIPGVVRYTVTAGKLTSPTILLNGSMESEGTFTDDRDIYNYKQNHNNKTYQEYVNANISVDYFVESLVGTNVTDATIIISGEGYKLGSTFYIDQFYNLSDHILNLQTNKCELDNCKLCLSLNTVSISGGTGYVVGDTFTVPPSPGDDGEITVASVDSSGGITSTTVSNVGSGFTSTPSVSYNGSTGSSATITITDDYGICYNNTYFEDDETYISELTPGGDILYISQTIDSPYSIITASGEAYLNGTYEIKAKDSLGANYSIDTPATVNIITEDIPNEDVIIFNADDFDLVDLALKSSGNNLSTSNVKLKLIIHTPNSFNISDVSLDFIGDFEDIDKPDNSDFTITDQFTRA
jgi:hypothetical protein|tara:strand:- start:14614 stop:16008 length:1395 start_codon:yes stop_codon:yes gene_type:complete